MMKQRRMTRRMIAWVTVWGCVAVGATLVAPTANAGWSLSVARQTLWQKGVGGYDTYRIPAVATATNGALLAFCEGRVNSSGDAGDIDIVLRRSADNGATWSDQQVVWSDGSNTCGNPVPIVDRDTGRVVLLMTWNLGTDGESAIVNKTSADTRRVFIVYSDDNGATWTTPTEITSSVKDPGWGWYATGPGGGVQIAKGGHAGRLVAACDHSNASGAYCSHVIYSDDGGTTWQLGGTVPDTGLNECQVAELSDGRLIVNMRNYNRTVKARRISYSADAGATWSAPVYDAALIEPICEAALERVRWPTASQTGIVAFLNPANETSRVNLTLRLSTDDASTWTQSQVLCTGPSAYSDLSVAENGGIVAVYECGTNSAYEEICSAQVVLSERVTMTTTSASSSSPSVFEDGLQVRFRADVDVNGGSVTSGDAVSAWQSGGGESDLTVTASGTQCPIWVPNAFVRAENISEPAVRFNRDLDDTQSYSNQWMGSSTLTRLNLLTNSTWFVVLNLLDDNLQASLFGFPESSVRFGAFFLNTPNPANTLRVHNGMTVGQFQMSLRVPYVLDSRRSLNLANLCTNGVDTVYTTGASGGNLTSDQQFRIGAMLNDVAGRPKADIAEVIVYNRALNDAERVILQNALAAKYGISLAANDLYTGKSAAAGDFDLDVVGIGKYTAAGSTPVPGSALVSACSAGLSLTALNGSVATDGEFLFAGHRRVSNGWTSSDTDGVTCNQRWTRSWRLQKLSADGIDARLTFDFEAAGGVSYVAGASYRLLYRQTDGEAFSALGVAAAESEGAVTFDLPNAALGDGEYTLGLGDGGAAYPQAGVSEGLTMWFRADRAASGAAATNGAPVNFWYNDGSIGSSAYVAADAASNAPAFKTDGFERATGVFEPVVRFNWDDAQGAPTIDNPHRLTTGSKTTDCGITDDSTWFLVFRTLTNHWDRGVFGSDNNTSRFGAFFTAVSSNRFRFQNNMLTYQTYEYSVPDQTVMLMDSRRFGPTNAAYISARADGATSGDAALSTTNALSYVKSHFRIGNQQFTTTTNNFIGDIAEIRVYNRAVNDAERIIIENHLAARYGKTLSANDLYTGKTAAAGDYDLDVVGLGCMTATGTAAVPGALTDSGDAAGLRLVALNGTLANNGEFVFAGHRSLSNCWTTADTDGVTCTNRWIRDWCLNRVVPLGPDDGLDVRLTFDRLTAGGGDIPSGGYRLLYRRSLSDTFTALAVAASEDGSKVSFDLTGDALTDGYYTLGTGEGAAKQAGASLCAGVGRSLRAWFRASDAVSENGTTVTNWGNLGLIGAALDVQPAVGSPLRVVNGAQRAAGVYEPVVRFDGTARLISPSSSDFGVSQDLTWFAVFNPTGSRSNCGLFGTDQLTTRFGGFFTGTAPYYPLRCHAFNSNGASYQCELTNVTQNVLQVADYSRQRLSSTYALSARFNGVVSVQKTATQSTPVAGRLKIGNMLSDGTLGNFVGDFAELRIYNRALCDAERLIVQNHLAARYGTTLATNDLYAGKSAVAGDCDLDVVGIGCTTNAATGFCPGTIAVSDSSAGLTLAALNGTLSGDGEYLLAGHNGASNMWVRSDAGTTGASYRWQREWYLSKTSADGMDAKLTFDVAAAGLSWRGADEEAVYKLLWRSDGGATYRDTELVPTIVGDTLEFDIPDASLVDGLYTIGAKVKSRGTMIQFK